MQRHTERWELRAVRKSANASLRMIIGSSVRK
jgi:hypothetical protein